MQEIYENFFKIKWRNSYGFWHKVTNRSEGQVRKIKDVLYRIGSDKIEILDVGCGEGDELKYAILKSSKDVRIIANDTSSDALRMYKKNLSNFTVVTKQCRLEDLPKYVKSRFDFILFSHCLYGSDLSGLFSSYFLLLKAGGSILVFIESKKSVSTKIKRCFWQFVHFIKYNENSAEDVVRELEENGIEYKVVEIHYELYLKKLEKIKKDGIRTLLIPFLLRSKQISEEKLSKISKFIESVAVHQKIKNKTFAIIVKR